jgi:hypothetical protein
MNFIAPIMINNSVNIAKYKLKLHQEMGANSQLSIFDVANLMDILRANEGVEVQSNSSIFFGFSMN